MVKEHFFHKITLLFTARLAKNWNIGGALRVAPVCSTPNTSLLSNLAVYNAERSELDQGSGKMVSGGRGRVSATHGRMAVGALVWHETGVTRMRARPLPRAPSDHTPHSSTCDSQIKIKCEQYNTPPQSNIKARGKFRQKQLKCPFVTMWYRTIVDSFLIRNEIKSLKKSIRYVKFLTLYMTSIERGQRK